MFWFYYPHSLFPNLSFYKYQSFSTLLYSFIICLNYCHSFFVRTNHISQIAHLPVYFRFLCYSSTPRAQFEFFLGMCCTHFADTCRFVIKVFLSQSKGRSFDCWNELRILSLLKRIDFTLFQSAPIAVINISPFVWPMRRGIEKEHLSERSYTVFPNPMAENKVNTTSHTRLPKTAMQYWICRSISYASNGLIDNLPTIWYTFI